MKFGAIKHALFASSLLLAAYSGGAAAHPFAGTISNNTAAGSTEGWSIECTNPGTVQVYLDVQYTAAVGNSANPGIMTATVTKGGVGRSVLDNTTGSGTGPGTGIYTGAGGTGTYFVTVQRTTAGAALYTINFHCADADGIELSGNPTATLVINN